MNHSSSVTRVVAFGAIAASAALAGCASSGYSTSYRATEGTPSQRGAALGEPLVERTAPVAEPQRQFAAYEKRGYVLIGSSSFNSDQRESEAGAIVQARKVGADLVVIVEPRPTASTMRTVAVKAPASSRNSPVTTFGGNMPSVTDSRQSAHSPQTFAMTVQHADFSAGYFVKQR